ncbi:MAG: hypothetical protein L0Y70_18775 [Gemmataceae bacterium]|nr:hypothetical protein [Gemmataceae bacterium]
MILIVAGLLAVARPVSARIIQTRPSPSQTWSPFLPLIVGGGFEFETDSEQSVFDFPLLVEYNFTERFRMSLEPNFVIIDSKAEDVRSASGFGDFETSLEYEFLRERRYRPALTAEGIVKWPTATDPDIGSPGRDYAFGLIASKDFVYVDVDLGLRYTFVGDPEAHDFWEVALAAEWPLNHRLSVLAEVITEIEADRSGRTGTEGTLGLSWRANAYLTLQGGGTVRSDGTWQVLFAWEWSFAGED